MSKKEDKETGQTDLKKSSMDPDATAEDVTHPHTGSTPVLDSLAGGKSKQNPGLITSNVME